MGVAGRSQQNLSSSYAEASHSWPTGAKHKLILAPYSVRDRSRPKRLPDVIGLFAISLVHPVLKSSLAHPKSNSIKSSEAGSGMVSHCTLEGLQEEASLEEKGGGEPVRLHWDPTPGVAPLSSEGCHPRGTGVLSELFTFLSIGRKA